MCLQENIFKPNDSLELVGGWIGDNALDVAFAVIVGCRWWFFLLLRRASRTLEGGPSERAHLLGIDREDAECGRRLAKVCWRRTTTFENVYIYCTSYTSSAGT